MNKTSQNQRYQPANDPGGKNHQSHYDTVPLLGSTEKGHGLKWLETNIVI